MGVFKIKSEGKTLDQENLQKELHLRNFQNFAAIISFFVQFLLFTYFLFSFCF
jgi:hypothetical protein